MSRKEREEAFRRNLVLDVAEKVFAEKGIDGATVSEIADKAELAKGSLYQLFSSKSDLINAIVHRKVDVVLEDVKKVLAQDIDPVEKVKLLIDQKLKSIWESEDFAKLFINEFHGFNWKMEIPILDCCMPEIHQMMSGIEDVIAEGQKEGQFRTDISPRMILAAMGGISNAIIHIKLKHGEEVDLEMAVKQATDLFLSGALPPREVSQK